MNIRIWNDIRKIGDEKIQSILLPCSKGLYLIQEGHSPMLCRLVKGIVVLHTENNIKRFFMISGGIFDFHGHQGSLFGSDIEELNEKDHRLDSLEK